MFKPAGRQGATVRTPDSPRSSNGSKVALSWLQGMMGGHKGLYDYTKQFSETDFNKDVAEIEVYEAARFNFSESGFSKPGYRKGASPAHSLPPGGNRNNASK